DSVTVTVANGPGNTSDWVALYTVGAPNHQYLSWQYLHGAQTYPATGRASATLTFAMPATGGDYEFRFLPRDGFTSTATSPVVTVSGVVARAPAPMAEAAAVPASGGGGGRGSGGCGALGLEPVLLFGWLVLATRRGRRS